MGPHYRSALVLFAIVSLISSIAGFPPTLFLHAAAMGAAAAQETDTDGDTMPDAWETFFGLDPNSAADAAGDPDGDGLSNAQEYAARRHPRGHHARYFAEGSTGYFDTTMAVLNLSSTQTAHVALAMLNEAGGVVSHQFSLGPLARQTIALSSIPGVSGAVSIIVESDVPVAADRTMTWGTSGLGLSLDSGSPGPATAWYFAEGATGPFLLYYLFENPGPTPANVTIRYLIEGAPPVTKTHTFGPYSRTTIFVNDEDPALANTSLGAVISSDVPILAERAMYVQSGGAFGGGAASSGANQLSTTWFFGEGATGPFFHCFLSLINPGSVAATATVTYHMSDGSTASKAYTVPAEGRRTVYLNGEGASDPTLTPLAFGPVWFTVASTQPILGERAMWWSTWPWYEGHAAPGSVTTDLEWAIPEGRHGGTDFNQTYVLIGNASPSTAGQVRVTLIPDAGASSTQEFTIAAGERLTLNIGEVFGLADARFSVLVESLGSPGVPLTVDYARYRSVGGVPFSGGGAAPAVAVTAAEDPVPTVSSTTPAANATDVAVDATLTVTFSEEVNVTSTAFTLECPSGTPIAVTNLTPSPATTFTLDPNVNLPVGTACVLRIAAAQVTDIDTIDPPDTMAVDVIVPFTTSTCDAITVTSTPSPAPGGNLTLPYGPVTFDQTGAVDPVTWTISSGALPAGLNLSAAGVLDGTPTESGTFNFTVRAGTAAGCGGTLPVTLAIAAGPNEPPSFTVGPNPTVLEDAGPQTIANWATGISPGAPPEEAGQIVTFTVTGNTNPSLFASGGEPAVAADGTLTFTPAVNASGDATITLTLSDDGGTANGGIDTSGPQIFLITVNAVNDAPSFTKGADQTVFEDAGAQSVSNWATAISPGPADETGQTLAFNVIVDTNPGLFSTPPAVAADGTLTYTPAANASGTATMTVTLSDNGGTSGGGADTSGPQTFSITVTAVNDAPSFTVGANQTVDEDSGLHTVSNWATAIGAGPADESSQTLTFNITGNTNPALFSGGPSVAADGTLTFTPAANASGDATITVTLSDNGGTANGGVDTSGSQNFTITVNAVNDPPSFTGGGNVSSAEDAGAQSFSNWATSISAGPSDETGQTLTFIVTGNTNPSLFSAGPAVASNGTLTYTSAPNAFGTSDITIVLQDNGGGTNQSAPYTFTIEVTPVNDAPTLTNATINYSTLGHTQLHVAGASEPGLTAIGDSDSALTKSGPSDIDGPVAPAAVPQSAQPTANGGTVTVASNGSFSYVPPVGFTGSDSFTVQVTDSVTPVNLTVQVNVGPIVWYVSNLNDANNPASGSDGRSNNAFETLADAQTNSLANQTIFVFRGDTGTTALTGGISLKNGQKFLGHGVGLTIAPFGTVVAPGTAPRIVTAGTNAVTVLANVGSTDMTGIEIRGHELASTGANAIDVTSADTRNLGIRISENTISGSGAGLEGIDINQGSSGTATLAVHDNTITSAGTGIDILRSNGSATITTFDDNVITGDNAGAGIIVNGVAFDATPGGAFDSVNGGGTFIGASGNGVTGGGLLLTNVSGALDFAVLDAFTDGGTAVSASGTGVFNGPAGTGTRVTFGAAASDFVSVGGPALVVSNLTLDAQLGSLTSTSSAATGVSFSTVTGTFSAPSGSTITNATGTDFSISGGTLTSSYAGTISDDDGPLVSIASSSGNKTFTGAITDGNDGDGSGISLTSNTGTIAFAGGLTLSTGANAAFTATGSGTVTVCDENPCNGGATGGLVNQITSTTGTALNVANVTIAATHLEFRSISSDGTGAGNGIVLNNTGSLGGLKVKGSGTAASGGTIRDKAIGISLTSTQHVSLDRLQLNDFADFAIRGTTVNNFALANSVIDGTNGTDPATDESSVRFEGLTGVASVTATSISGGLEDNFKVVNTSGVLNRITFDTVTIGANSTSLGNDGIGIEGSGAATVNVTVQNSVFTSSRGDLFGMSVLGGSGDLVFNGNTLSNNHPGIATGGGGVSLFSLGTAVFTLAVNDNTFRDSVGHAVLIVKDIGTGTLTGSFTNNEIGLAGTADSGSLEGDGLKMQQAGQGTMTMTVTGNFIRQYNNNGIHMQAGAGLVESGAMNVTISNNTVSDPGTNPAVMSPNQGIHLNSGVTPGDTFAVCVAVGANSITNSGRNAGGDFRFRQRQDTTVKLPGYGGTPGDTTAVVNFLNATFGGSPVGGTASANFPTGGGGFIGGASCP